MKISFFEEFPDSSNLSKLNLIKFPTKLYLADYNIEGYKQYRKELKDKYKNLKEVIWWPILNVSEGYWLSPWSERRALLRTFHNLLKEDIPVLWDAELPRKRSLLFSQFFKHFKNKKLIKSFFKKYKGQIYTAEYLKESSFLERSCLTFNPQNYNNIKIKMFYTSVHKWLTEEKIKSIIKEFKKKYGDKIFIGLGTIAIGINGNEKILTPENLEKDLKICRELGIDEVVIFRLGGINEEYIKIINKFI